MFHLRLFGISIIGTSAEAIHQDTTKILGHIQKQADKMVSHRAHLDAERTKIDTSLAVLDKAEKFAKNILKLTEIDL